MHELNVFITLTYSDEFLPPDGSLVKRHFQTFMKRLRKLHGHRKVRYFHCGEYGDQTNRPHYHAILFGIDFADKRLHSKNAQGNPLYVSDTLDKLWGLGNCWLGAVTFESAAYVARYCLKKVNGDLAESHYEGREPEYATMSRRPGIGAGWYEAFKDDVYPSDFVVLRGHKVSPPKYYDKLRNRELLTDMETVKLARIGKAKKHKADQTPERLEVRRIVQESKMKLLKRSI